MKKPIFPFSLPVLAMRVALYSHISIAIASPQPCPTSQRAAVSIAIESNVVITAYCPCHICCGKWAEATTPRTASGIPPQEGRTCAASRKYPFGTVLDIKGVGKRIVEDRLALRFDDRVDIYFNVHKDAKNFGIRKTQITIWNKK